MALTTLFITRGGSRGASLSLPRAPVTIVLSLSSPRSWDEWVPEERLKKHTPENLLQQKKLVEAQKARDKAEREAAEKAAASELAKKSGVNLGGGGAVDRKSVV